MNATETGLAVTLDRAAKAVLTACAMEVRDAIDKIEESVRWAGHPLTEGSRRHFALQLTTLSGRLNEIAETIMLDSPLTQEDSETN